MILKFKGWWQKKKEVKDSPKPWETFEIYLFGIQAEDCISNPKNVRRILREAGLDIVKINKEDK